jgi:hypothetical protein
VEDLARQLEQLGLMSTAEPFAVFDSLLRYAEKRQRLGGNAPAA